MQVCNEHDEKLSCKYCRTLEHFDSCPVYKKYNQCACLLNTKYELEINCSYCGLVYEHIEHTNALYEHEQSEKTCKFDEHRIFIEVIIHN